ncbi:DUF4390 domain-containing protein [Methylotenera sp.]|uniref:DUF4390 domain-containing protein n=1 Tax=Methylotenera sp. TaxID=2051956 RepID=UPI0024876358|nr:DUF4390 domain-containing protein [Methylotenera sp.]MDI1298510.1 DUF4390 domain-containing protein [Methylotenera sp.]
MANLSPQMHMMAFSMHCCKKIKLFFSFCLLMLIATTALAGSSSMSIRSASLVALDDSYALNADVDMKFSEKMEEAISKGFELNFLIEFQLSKPRKYWFDDEVATVTHRVTLSYHALSRQFLVIRGDQQKAFVRLDEATDDLSEISDLKVFQKSEVEKGEHYKAAVLMRLDPKKLPKVLQGDTIGSDDWKMSSQRFEWVPNLFK